MKALVWVVICGAAGAVDWFSSHSSTTATIEKNPSPSDVARARACNASHAHASKALRPSTAQAPNLWLVQHHQNRLAARAAADDARATPVLVLLGDSLFESLVGTMLGQPSPVTAPSFDVEARYGRPVAVLAIAGDATSDLLWRLPHEVVPALRAEHRAVFVILIGTNNLVDLRCCFSAEAVADGILAVAAWLLEHVAGRVVVLDVLPRFDRWPWRGPPPCAALRGRVAEAGPFFLDEIDRINGRIASRIAESSADDVVVTAAAERRRTNFTATLPEDRLEHLDCTPAFRANRSLLVDDGIHLSAAGHDALAECLLTRSRFLLRAGDAGE
mmetsp:Transcript_11961/g.48177  ORF Transcript_11961/g.48177 Transcript_11961/m.48177 type:complete len:330 (+) Transcript_11961:127-1116(+)